MKNLLVKIATVLICSLTIYSCDILKDIFPEKNLTDEEKKLIISSINNFSTINDSIMKTENPLKGFNAFKDLYSNDPLIEKIEINESGLYIKYKNGGVISWLLPAKDQDPPYWKSGEIKTQNLKLKAGGIGENTVGNKKVAIMNQQSNDESRDSYLRYYNKAQEEFESQGFEVNRIDASDITLSLIAKDLKKYGSFYYITHGGFSTDNTWICTGEVGNSEDLMSIYEDDWINQRISIGTVTEVRNGENQPILYYNFSEDFISKSYKENDFPNSLFYLTACQALKNTSRLADAFVNAGCGVFIGWNETNSLGKHTGQMLFDFLLGGKLLNEAIDVLPEDAKVEKRSDENGDYTAELLFYPENKSDFYLVSEEFNSKIIITSHDNIESCNNRIQEIKGFVEGVDVINNGILELNGIPLELKITNKIYFSQTVVLQKGENIIRIVTKGTKDVNKVSVEEKEIKLKGEFPPLDLFTELRWNTNNTDIDIHLLPPGSSLDDLFTDKDCFFDNQTTLWNAFLDVDELYGFGPEHITIPSVLKEGVYTLYVHFWKNHNNYNTPTDFYIDVTTNNTNSICIGPLKLSSPRLGMNSNGIGDLTKVCEISFPDGKIRIINEKVILLKSALNRISK
jgi:uncharacterized protein YfaP (DUF2135 family)